MEVTRTGLSCLRHEGGGCGASVDELANCLATCLVCGGMSAHDRSRARLVDLVCDGGARLEQPPAARLVHLSWIIARFVDRDFGLNMGAWLLPLQPTALRAP